MILREKGVKNSAWILRCVKQTMVCITMDAAEPDEDLKFAKKSERLQNSDRGANLRHTGAFGKTIVGIWGWMELRWNIFPNFMIKPSGLCICPSCNAFGKQSTKKKKIRCFVHFFPLNQTNYVSAPFSMLSMANPNSQIRPARTTLPFTYL